MYETFFGLKKRPFRANATGSDVFVGPQTAKTMAGFRTALATQDAVIAVSGPAGTGKTALVTRALEGIGAGNKTVRVGRMQMDARDVLESLLIVLGVQDRPAGTILRFTTLRRTLRELQEADTQVFVVVEDAIRTGADVLAELEALTSADAGESDGAAIVLMGDERLSDFLKDPQLAQLSQRIRQRHKILPLCEAELRGYLRHCFRLAGGDFDQSFDAKSLDLLHRLSDGTPRVVNSLVDATLTAAATQGIRPVPAELIAKVAADQFDLRADDFDFSGPTGVAIDATAPQKLPVIEPEPLPELQVEPLPELQVEPLPELQPEPLPELQVEPLPELQVEPLRELQPEPEPEPLPELQPEPLPELEAEEPVIVFADEDAPADVIDDVPELIQDTLPDLAVLAPELAMPDQPVQAATGTGVEADAPDLEQHAEPAPLAIEPTVRDLPQLEPEVESTTVVNEDIPEWDRDPTLAELKPDLDALEAAMAFAHGGSGTQSQLSEDDSGAIVPEQPDKKPEAIPEITLDKSIETGIENQFAETGTDLPERVPAKADAELEKIAAEIAKARTLEDVDDKMAETLFGAEISMIAAQVIAAGPPDQAPANDPQSHDAHVAPGIPQAALDAAEEISLQSNSPATDGAMGLSASQRLKTVRALNAAVAPGTPAAPPNQSPRPAAEAPESIEDQINTSITQTLKALKVPQAITDDDEDTGKSGFFGRFRRS